MKKNFTSIAFALCLSIAASAQTTTIRVQGAPRKVSAAVAARLQKAAATTTGIDFSKIQRWTGSGDCQAALAIKWADGQNEGKTLVWGYRWNSTETKTGEDLVRAVVKADPALYMIADPKNAYGFTIGGFGYDADADRYVTITTTEAELYPRNGMVSVIPDNFESSAATDWSDDGDAWNSGWYTGFWNYSIADKADDALQMSMTGAPGRTLTDGCVDAYVFGYFDTEHEANVYDGNLEYLPATTDYTQGTFIVNEDWFGHNNGSVNFLGYDGAWDYNHLHDLGVTSCYGTFFGNRFYVVSKQAGNGGRLTICDSNSTRVIGKIDEIGGDGRSFCGVDEHKAYVSTSNGISIIDLDNMKMTGAVSGIDGGEYGNMVRLGDYVYASLYGKALAVIDCATDKAVATVDSPVYSIVMSKDGQLWVSTPTGIARVNTATNTLEDVALGEGTGAPYESSFAWTPDGLCASLQHNALYWTSASGWSTYKVYKYDIDKSETKLVVDLSNDPEGRSVYGCSFRVDPTTDNLYLSAAVGYTNDYKVRRYDADGKLLDEYVMNDAAKNYWFPGMFTFPDTEDPVAGDISPVSVEEGKTAELDLANACTDADNFQAAIVKSVEKMGDESVATAYVKDGKLVVSGVKAGATEATVKFCSNGISTTAKISVLVTTATAINNTSASAERREVARYTIDGKRIIIPQQGVNIVKYSDGTTKKVVVE